MRLLRGVLLTGVAASVACAPAKAADALHGASLFQANCATCHSLDPTQANAGPTLLHVVGRKAGSVAGFGYTKAMKDSGIVWTEDKLDAFLAKPSAVVPGTAMFKSVPAAGDRADIIAYLKSAN